MSLPIKVLLPTPPLPVKATTRLRFETAGRRRRITSMCWPSARNDKMCASARRSRAAKRRGRSSSMAHAAPLPKEINDRVHAGARPEHLGDAHFQEPRNIRLRDDAADKDLNLFQAGIP